MIRNLQFSLVLFSILATSCTEKKEYIDIEPIVLHDTMQKLTDIIVHDIFSPPVASRVYVYPSIAAYEIMVQTDSTYISLKNQLNQFNGIPAPQNKIDFELAAIQAFINVGKALIFSEDKFEEYEIDFLSKIKEKNLDEKIINNSLSYAKAVSDAISEWYSKDNYNETRTYQKFDVIDEIDRWQPTPPGYFEAIEPHWSKIRQFVIDSSNQFMPDPPTKFDMTKDSDFYKEVMEVYEVSNNLNEEQAEIASFWDCNPFVINVQGHAMFATKKITPGGHWINIAKIACQKDSANFMKSIATYTLTSIALADGFISCWDEKYRSNLIRPETVINNYIDPNWLPLLQTPPFPEYTSGHSVISGAAGVALSSIYGDSFSFEDDSELVYGLPIRKYTSFTAASDEAAISRLYGGIHYMPAIKNGVTQGRELGKYLVNKIKMKHEKN
ncbi:MAG: vanadium-dependent haloperoxidase [Cyclobacteriaceae bacterium]|nr:vanadium-dependent haloperoxidase [Cyclobacteriaceae bacterium]